MKAYTTRVGEGALPTEDAQLAQMLHDMGREFGATTGRARRCGWFDAVATRYATMINGIDELAITNLDGLDQVDPIRICVGYRLMANGSMFRPAMLLNWRTASRFTKKSPVGIHPYNHCTEILGSSFGCEELCEIHFRTDRRQTFHGQCGSRARRNDRVVKS